MSKNLAYHFLEFLFNCDITTVQAVVKLPFFFLTTVSISDFYALMFMNMFLMGPGFA